MNDLISRNEAAKRLEDLAKQKEDTFAGDVLEFAAKVVRGVPSAEVPHWATEQAYKNGYEDGKPKWISVKDRLPGADEKVLILCKNGAMFVGVRGSYYGGTESRFMVCTALASTKLLNKGRVTHWMPLPQPPKGD